MRGSKNRVVLNVEAMEAKVLLSALAPAAAIRVAVAPAVATEHVGAMPMVAPGNNVIFINNSTSYKIEVSAELQSEKKGEIIDGKTSKHFRFNNRLKDAIFVTSIESKGLGPGPLPTKVKLTPNKFNAYYLNATYTVSVSNANKFQVSTTSST